MDRRLASLTYRMYTVGIKPVTGHHFRRHSPLPSTIWHYCFQNPCPYVTQKNTPPTQIESFKSFNCTNATAMLVLVTYSEVDDVVHWAVMHKMKWYFVIMSLCYCWMLLDVTGWNAWGTLCFVVHHAQTCKPLGTENERRVSPPRWLTPILFCLSSWLHYS